MVKVGTKKIKLKRIRRLTLKRLDRLLLLLKMKEREIMKKKN